MISSIVLKDALLSSESMDVLLLNFFGLCWMTFSSGTGGGVRNVSTGGLGAVVIVEGKSTADEWELPGAGLLFVM